MATAGSPGASSQDAIGCRWLGSSWPRSIEVQIGPERLSLTDFLMRCAQSFQADGTLTAPTPDLIRARDAFLSAGVPAVRMTRGGSAWLQFGLSVGREPRSHLYAALGATVRECLEDEDIHGFFFMHKFPGIRVRFETADHRRERLDALLQEQFRDWQREGLIEQWHPAVYEPEAYLFGGHISMRSVHRVFTADSLVWLAFHALAQENTTDEPPGPAWAMSLAMLRALLDGLEIVGWEDLDVWDRVRWQTGRHLNGKASSSDGFSHLAGSLREAWSRPEALNELLSPRVRSLLDVYRRTVDEEAARWLAHYFRTSDALIGPREAAAYLIVFHWNRSGFSLIRQALFAEALAARVSDRGQ